MCFGNIQFAGVYIWILFGQLSELISLWFCCEISFLAMMSLNLNATWIHWFMGWRTSSSPMKNAQTILRVMFWSLNNLGDTPFWFLVWICHPNRLLTNQTISKDHPCCFLYQPWGREVSDCKFMSLVWNWQCFKGSSLIIQLQGNWQKKLHRWVWFHDFTAVHAEF